MAVKKAEDGMLYFLAKPVKGEEDLAKVNTDGKTAEKKSMDVNEAHEKYAHVGERMLRKTMGKFGYELTGIMKACDGCMQAKAVNKVTKMESTCPEERLFLDTSGPFAPSVGGSRYDVKLVVQASRKTWGGKITRKLQVPVQVEREVDELNVMGRTVKFLVCDNAGEQQEKLQLDFTAPNTPQMNRVVERKFVTDRARGLAMIFGARLTEEARRLLRAEAESTAEKISNIVCNSRSDKSPHDLFDGKPLKLIPECMVEFGRIGYVTIRKKILKKWDKKSTKCIMVGRRQP
jgi:hypothetical protein